jgi:hypothetical protein
MQNFQSFTEESDICAGLINNDAQKWVQAKLRALTRVQITGTSQGLNLNFITAFKQKFSRKSILVFRDEKFLKICEILLNYIFSEIGKC